MTTWVIWSCIYTHTTEKKVAQAILRKAKRTGKNVNVFKRERDKSISHEHNLIHEQFILLFKSHTKRYGDSCLLCCWKKWETF